MSATALRVLLIEDTVDSLATLGVALLEKGFEVSVMTDPRTALESPAGSSFHVLLVEEATLRALGPKLEALLRARAEPHLVLVGDAETAWAKNEVSLSDVDLVAKRVMDLATDKDRISEAPPLSEAQPSGNPPGARSRAGNLSLGWLPTVVEPFVVGRATGMVSVTTSAGAGELRLARGELVDAAYSKLDGVKAVHRLARETEGSWSFTNASSLVMRRITMSTADLLRQVPMENERVKELEGALGDLSGWALLADPIERRGPEGAALPTLGPLASAVALRLSVPRTLGAFLDESPETDAELLAALVELDAAVLLRRVRSSARAITFESPMQIDRATAKAAQARAAGFLGPARIVFAGSPSGLSMLAYAAARLEESTPSIASIPEAPVPYEIAQLRLSEESFVALVALPLDPIYSPLWPLTIAGASSVVSRTDPVEPRLAAACAGCDVALIEATLTVADLDVGSPDHVARLVRAGLDLV
jgi:hypothetical protein